MAVFHAKNRFVSCLLSALLLAATHGAIAQSAPAEAKTAATMPTTLTLTGAGDKTLTLTQADLDALPQTTASFTQDGTEYTYSGPLLYDVLKKEGVAFGHDMTGAPMASYLLASAIDGYQVVYSLAEFDPAFAGEKIIVADKVNNGPLPNRQLPFRLVVPGDKMHARSMFSVVKLDVVHLRGAKK